LIIGSTMWLVLTGGEVDDLEVEQKSGSSYNRRVVTRGFWNGSGAGGSGPAQNTQLITLG